MSAVGKSKRDRQWSSLRQTELIYTVLLIALGIGLFAYASSRPTSDLVFWLASGAALLVSLGLYVRQYQVLDELGKSRFLKSWAVSGVVTGSGLAWALLWGTYESVKLSGSETSATPNIPFWFIYLSLVAGLIGMGLTNLYLRRRDDRAS